MGEILDNYDTKPERSTTLEYGAFLDSTAGLERKLSLRFEDQFSSPTVNQTSASPPPGFGRRRSKSQGQLRGASSVLDAEFDPFGLRGEKIPDDKSEKTQRQDFSDLNWPTSSLDPFASAEEPVVGRRKIASSFHVFEEDANLFSSPLSADVGSSENLDFISPTRSRSRIQQLQQHRERAESDFGRYPNFEPVRSTTEPTRSTLRSPELRSSLGFRPQSVPNTAPQNQSPSPKKKNYNSGYKQRPAAGTNKNDWVCFACGNQNYSWRQVCNMRKCRAPKPGHLSDPAPPGAWSCQACGNLNYAERVVCNMRKCRAPRPVDPRLVSNLTQQQQPQPQFMYNPQFAGGYTQSYGVMGMPNVGYSNQIQPQQVYGGQGSPKMQFVNSVNVQDLQQQFAQNFNFNEDNQG